jgi:uncharacterized protein with NAD-binding domain and iron-sulfur cluster
MAALTAAYELSEGNWTDRFERITVYQRGWRLGGKGASSRGPHGRIEEHGLHLLLGYYDRTFDVMRRCYDELDRTGSDPGCPIRTWDEAVAPSNWVGVTDREGDRWVPWVASFPAPGSQPSGSRGPLLEPFGLSAADLAVRSVRLLIEFFRSLAGPDLEAGAVYLSTSPEPKRSTPAPGATPIAILRGAGLLGLVVQLSWAQRMAALAEATPAPQRLGLALSRVVEPLRAALRNAVVSDPGARRTYQLVELVTTNLAGILTDGLLGKEDGVAAIDHLDYRDWLLRHGIEPGALDSPLLRGMYDLVFAYEQGDPARPRFCAGLGLQLATRMLLGYSGGLFWKMQAGMGEVIFAPLYQVLRNRGVEFRFFHRVDALRLSPDGRSIGSVEIGVQADVTRGVDRYDPLIRVKGLPCWPSAPLDQQLRDPEAVRGLGLESFWSPRRDTGLCTLTAGRDFDFVVFGMSLGMVPHVGADLVAHSHAWRSMSDNIGTVATQSLQLWLREDERALGWHGPDGVVVSGFVEPFDTWASMSHLIPAEDWSRPEQPRTIAYFCSPVARDDAADPDVDARRETESVQARARSFLDSDVGALWPGAVRAGGFRWELLCDGTSPGEVQSSGPERLASQYWRANVDPSDLYVQSLPGTNQYRLRPDASGFENLFVVGDWTDCGLNAGCVEAATRSGVLAARAVADRLRLRAIDEFDDA